MKKAKGGRTTRKLSKLKNNFWTNDYVDLFFTLLCYLHLQIIKYFSKYRTKIMYMHEAVEGNFFGWTMILNKMFSLNVDSRTSNWCFQMVNLMDPFFSQPPNKIYLNLDLNSYCKKTIARREFTHNTIICW